MPEPVEGVGIEVESVGVTPGNTHADIVVEDVEPTVLADNLSDGGPVLVVVGDEVGSVLGRVEVAVSHHHAGPCPGHQHRRGRAVAHRLAWGLTPTHDQGDLPVETMGYRDVDLAHARMLSGHNQAGSMPSPQSGLARVRGRRASIPTERWLPPR